MIRLRINGVERTFDGDPATPLLWYLRDELGLTGTIHIDGQAMRACVIGVGNAEGKGVVTIEGLSAEGSHPVQQAWRAHDVAQCGYCQSGQIMQAAALLQATPKPTDAQIDEAMAGNLCRCGTYTRIRAAIRAAAQGGTR
jgi:isoquinoline 1-oxidoreductase subunit alpha